MTSISLNAALFFYTFSFLKPLSDINPVVLGPEIEGATIFNREGRSPKNSLIFNNFGLILRAVVFCTLLCCDLMLRESCLIDFLRDLKQIWRVLSTLLSLNVEGHLESFLNSVPSVSRKSFGRQNVVKCFVAGDSGNAFLTSFLQPRETEITGTV